MKLKQIFGLHNDSSERYWIVCINPVPGLLEPKNNSAGQELNKNNTVLAISVTLLTQFRVCVD